ncbi:RiPP maturation radical SAM C-methyltransferase [Sulfidibacter corallicola]|uniref:RiPP maturation radical SAM C-methyltransferase n=1 Tax=Sulfidibacter corallicola TaxID=2818388 RepID=A0A8A4TKH4_SULCO|nr:RiPP maturation radical SAM C-methyltransferase [Sulfidibacter corallicola]QTD50083.1 RiPP maturation radical SAM C-methyltransferase [Sulfidibacter corallicola]
MNSASHLFSRPRASSGQKPAADAVLSDLNPDTILAARERGHAWMGHDWPLDAWELESEVGALVACDLRLDAPISVFEHRLAAALRRTSLDPRVIWGLSCEAGHLARRLSALEEGERVHCRIGPVRALVTDEEARQGVTLFLPFCRAFSERKPLLLTWEGTPAAEVADLLFADAADPHAVMLRLQVPTPPASEPAPIESGALDPADVVLVNMPFGSVRWPSLGLSLLQSALDPYDVVIEHFSIHLARLLGLETYQWLSFGKPENKTLLAEWLFRPCLFPDRTRPGDAFFRAMNADVPLLPYNVFRDISAVTDLLDGFLDACAEEILARRPTIVGFTSIFQQQVASLALAKRLAQRRPDLYILFGGANVEGVMGLETLRQFPFIDAVVNGEADHVVRDLVSAVMAGREPEGIAGVFTRAWLRQAGDALPQNPPSAPLVRRMDDLPLPRFDSFFRSWRRHFPGRAKLRLKLLFESSRGCWWGERNHCTFCGMNGLGMTYRSKSPDRTIDELKRLADLYPDRPVVSVDNILDWKYFRNLLPRLAESDLELELFYEVKANMKKAQLRLLKKAGIGEIQPGIESLSSHVLHIMRKGVSALQNVQLLKWCRVLGIKVNWNFLYGFPGETNEDYAELLRILPTIVHLPPPLTVTRIRMDRFSPNFHEAEALGFAAVEPAASYGHIYPFEADTLSNLAYYFDYEYRAARDPEAQAQPLREAIAFWKDHAEASMLLSLDKGDHMMIFDRRPNATLPLHTLDATQRALYLACDGIKGLKHLCGVAAEAEGRPVSEEEVLERLREPLAAGLMLREGQSLLSLGIGSEGEGA